MLQAHWKPLLLWNGPQTKNRKPARCAVVIERAELEAFQKEQAAREAKEQAARETAAKEAVKK